MTLREMILDDIPQMVEIEKELFTDPWTALGLYSFFSREENTFFVVEEKGRILGYLGLQRVLEEADILNVAVRKDRQKEGIGSFLLNSSLRLLEEVGVETVHLEVRKTNMPAIRLYERAGFVPDGLRKNYYDNPTEDAILMSRRCR